MSDSTRPVISAREVARSSTRIPPSNVSDASVAIVMLQSRDHADCQSRYRSAPIREPGTCGSARKTRRKSVTPPESTRATSAHPPEVRRRDSRDRSSERGAQAAAVAREASPEPAAARHPALSLDAPPSPTSICIVGISVLPPPCRGRRRRRRGSRLSHPHPTEHKFIYYRHHRPRQRASETAHDSNRTARTSPFAPEHAPKHTRSILTNPNKH